MPKMKSHSGAKKRFRFTGTGKLMHRQAGKMHLNEHKSSTPHPTPRWRQGAGAWRRRQGQEAARQERLSLTHPRNKE